MLTIFCSLSLSYIIKHGDVDKSVYGDPPAAYYYDLQYIPLNDDGEPYDYEDILSVREKYIISNYQGLKVFAALINWNKNDFASEFEIKLTADIDCGGATIGIGWWYAGGFLGIGSGNRYFKGECFNGNNHTIYNFKLNSGYFYGGTADAYGFFSRIDSGTTIKNLRLKDYSLTVSSASSDYGQATGGLVGYLNGGTIQNCIVENFTLTSTYSNINTVYQNNKMCFGGIFGVGYGTVSDCLVKDISTSNCKTTVGIGPADFPYIIEMRGGNNVWFSYTSYYPASSSTIKSCVVQNFTCSNDYAITQYVSDCVRSSGGYTYSTYGHTIITCQNTAGTPSVSSWSSGGGASQGTIWYYGGSGYNDGYPYLRQFISDWTTINFSAGTGGSVDPSSIQIPSDADQTINTTGNVIVKLEQTVEAKPDTETGYHWTSWTKNSATSYTANFERLSYTVTFNNATGVSSGDSIPPSGTSYTIYHGEEITASHTSGPGPLTLKYTFKNTSGTTCNVTYTIPAKYKLVNSNNPGTITGAVTITPTVEIRTFDVTLKAATGSNKTSDTNWTVTYGESVTYNSANISFTYNGTTITYTPSSGYRFDGLLLTEDGTGIDTGFLNSIKGNIVIQPTFARWFTVTFVTIGDTTAPTSSQTMEVKENDTITASLSTDQKTLTYSYKGSSVVYRASQYHILSNGDNELQITQAHTKEIEPESIFYACTVTMGNIDSNIGTRTITGDSYGDSEDGIFAVEFDTTVNFTIDATTGLFKYTYTFGSGEVVTYTITNEQYAMQYTLSNGERTSISNGLNGTFNEDSYTFTVGTTTKNISPTFGLKQYAGELG